MTSPDIDATLFLYDRNYILKADSIIKCPPEETTNWNDSGKFYSRYKNKFEELIESDQAILLDPHSAKSVNEPVCSSPSFAGALCKGASVNDWDFWQ